MPDFGSPFAGLASDRPLTESELIRAIRFMISAEYEAIQLYMQLAESTDNVLAQNVLKDIADEERVHAGEFMRLLLELAPDEQQFMDQGAQEVEEEFLGAAPAPEAPAAADEPAAPGDGSLGIGSLGRT
jgi:rubrerythrin